MSDMTPERLDALTKQLRGWDHCWPAPWLEAATIEAADAITALRAEVERLTRERDEANAEAQWKSGAMAAAEADAAAAREQARSLASRIPQPGEDDAAMRPAPAEEWRSDMQNAPGYEGPIHARGLWVHNFDCKPTEFYAVIGYVDEDGDFITGDGPAGWTAMDFEFWMPIPAFPAAPAQGGRDDA